MTGNIPMAKNRRGTRKDKNVQKNSRVENKENGSFPILSQNGELPPKSSLGKHCIADANLEFEDKIPFQGSRYGFF